MRKNISGERREVCACLPSKRFSKKRKRRRKREREGKNAR
jgi:hypothetical protein